MISVLRKDIGRRLARKRQTLTRLNITKNIIARGQRSGTALQTKTSRFGSGFRDITLLPDDKALGISEKSSQLQRWQQRHY